jgi:hypothetical protein
MLSIPKPCAESWDAMTPTAAGRYCARCQTEVVDFTRMSEAEMLAFMASRRGRSVCAFMAAPARPVPVVKPMQGPQRWLLAAVAVLSGQLLAARELPPQSLPVSILSARQDPAQRIITIRGTVLDDSLQVPVQGARIYIGSTPYGMIANERGEFSISLPADWAPVSSGVVKLRIGRVPFALTEQVVEVSVKETLVPAPLIIRQQSVPRRGFYKGKPVIEADPAPVPNTFFRLADQRTVIILRGVVRDDSLNVLVPGAQVFIDGTKYGAVANEQGEFELTFARDWKAAAQRLLLLRVLGGHFAFAYKQVPIDINLLPAMPLVVRLVPTPGFMGKICRTNPPVRPPRPHKGRH